MVGQNWWVGLEVSPAISGRFYKQPSFSGELEAAYSTTVTMTGQRYVGQRFLLGGGFGFGHWSHQVSYVISNTSQEPLRETRITYNQIYIDLKVQAKVLLWRRHTQGFIRGEAYLGPHIFNAVRVEEEDFEGRFDTTSREFNTGAWGFPN